MFLVIPFLIYFARLILLTYLYTFLLTWLIRKIKEKDELRAYHDNLNWLLSKRRLTKILVFFMLFVFSNTHWGNHGFRDYARIPLRGGIAVENIDWTEYAWIDVEIEGEEKKLETTSFLLYKNFVLGNYDSWFNSVGGYFIFNLKNGKLREFNSRTSFDEYAQANNLPKSRDFKDFRDNYWSYWGGWRFCLLP